MPDRIEVEIGSVELAEDAADALRLHGPAILALPVPALLSLALPRHVQARIILAGTPALLLALRRLGIGCMGTQVWVFSP